MTLYALLMISSMPALAFSIMCRRRRRANHRADDRAVRIDYTCALPEVSDIGRRMYPTFSCPPRQHLGVPAASRAP